MGRRWNLAPYMVRLHSTDTHLSPLSPHVSPWYRLHTTHCTRYTLLPPYSTVYRAGVTIDTAKWVQETSSPSLQPAGFYISRLSFCYHIRTIDSWHGFIQVLHCCVVHTLLLTNQPTVRCLHTNRYICACVNSSQV